MCGLKKIVLFCLVNITLVFAGTDENSIKLTVQHYNNAIIFAGKTGRTDDIRPFVTEKIATKTHLWIMAWHDDELRMDAKLLSMDFRKIAIDSNRSRVKTFEKWTYLYNHPTKREYYPPKAVTYEMEYSLIRQNAKWIIEDTKILSETERPLAKAKK